MKFSLPGTFVEEIFNCWSEEYPHPITHRVISFFGKKQNNFLKSFKSVATLDKIQWTLACDWSLTTGFFPRPVVGGTAVLRPAHRRCLHHADDNFNLSPTIVIQGFLFILSWLRLFQLITKIDIKTLHRYSRIQARHTEITQERRYLRVLTRNYLYLKT